MQSLYINNSLVTKSPMKHSADPDTQLGYLIRWICLAYVHCTSQTSTLSIYSKVSRCIRKS